MGTGGAEWKRSKIRAQRDGNALLFFKDGVPVMIVSASRRTDIPAYYSEWFLERLREGYVLVRNPMNPHQISRVRLDPEAVDGIVFWSKNPAPLLDRLDELKNYAYYFQFTVTGYGPEIEPGLPDKERSIIPTFQRLADRIGPDRVIWRYDPIFLSQTYSMEFHLRRFEALAEQLSAFTRKCTVSFLDLYRNTRRNLSALALTDFPSGLQERLAGSLAEIAKRYGLCMDTCAEKIDLQKYNIAHARCIDGQLFSRLLGCPVEIGKDKNQRPECGCVESVDIGAYNTCRNGCRYCYANYLDACVHVNHAQHDPHAPLLIGKVGAEDRIAERKPRVPAGTTPI